MSITIFTKENMPQTGAALREKLQQALDKNFSLDDFVQLIRELTQLETKYQLSSSEFFTKFEQGKMGDDMEFMRWANKYEIYQEIKAEMESVFHMLRQYALPETSA